ncbi:MAG: hypothetical protein M3004_10350 [Bacteroidota bacterium]|nr:hypothetical protein [Bacteroidota bacterium]
MTEAEIYFNELTEKIANAKAGKMFGALCMKMPNGKSAAMFWKNNIVVKLHGKALQDALSLDGTKLFEPMEGRPMKEWVQIPFDYKSKWEMFAKISTQSVEKIEKKPTKKKK